MKRGMAILTVLMLLSGCTPLQYSSESAPNGYTAAYTDKWAYCRLSEQQQRNYRAVYTAVYEGFAYDETVALGEAGEVYQGVTVPLPESLATEAEIHELYRAFVQDHPSFFYLGNAYGYSGNGSYDTLKLTYTMSSEERIAARDKFEKVCEELLARLDGTMTDFEKELQLHDALLDRCRYDPEADVDSYTAYGALVEGKAVCEGYARAMQYLLERAGITATTVKGFSGDTDVAHLWNAVVLNGQLYYLDPTWNDTDFGITYTYFNVTAAELSSDHRASEETAEFWSATATERNYYRMMGSYLDTVEQGRIAEHVAARFAAGEKTVQLRFSPQAWDTARFFLQSTSWFLETVNACLPKEVPPIEDYRLNCNEKYNTVTICKKPLDSGV